MDLYVIRRGGWRSPAELEAAASPEAIRKHASLADLPVDEIVPVADTVVVRPDPQAATA